jgi:hypothetical protein
MAPCSPQVHFAVHQPQMVFLASVLASPLWAHHQALRVNLASPLAQNLQRPLTTVSSYLSTELPFTEISCQAVGCLLALSKLLTLTPLLNLLAMVLQVPALEGSHPAGGTDCSLLCELIALTYWFL